MGYVDQNLMAGESVVYRTRLHWVLFVFPLIIIVIGILGLLAGPLSAARLPLWIALLGVLALLASAAAILTSEFAVTNKRVIIKAGVFWRRSIEILLVKVEAISVNQSLLGRILGYGSLMVGGSGGTKEVFELIQAPLVFRRKVQEQASLKED